MARLLIIAAMCIVGAMAQHEAEATLVDTVVPESPGEELVAVSDDEEGADPAGYAQPENAQSAVTRANAHTTKEGEISVEVYAIRHGMSCSNAIKHFFKQPDPTDTNAMLGALRKVSPKMATTKMVKKLSSAVVRDPHLSTFAVKKAASMWPEDLPAPDFIGSSYLARTKETAKAMFPSRTVHVLPNICEVTWALGKQPAPGATSYGWVPSMTPCPRSGTDDTHIDAATYGNLAMPATQDNAAAKPKYMYKMLAKIADNFVPRWKDDVKADSSGASCDTYSAQKSMGSAGWPGKCSWGHFEKEILPKIVQSLADQGKRKIVIAILTHSNLMYANLQPLLFTKSWVKPNQMVRLDYAYEKGALTEHKCTDTASCKARILGGYEYPAKVSCGDVSTCSAREKDMIQCHDSA